MRSFWTILYWKKIKYTGRASTLRLGRVVMRKVFWENPYQHTLQTTVAAVNDNELLFDATIIFTEL